MINEIIGTLWRECELLIKQNRRKEACGVYAAVVRLATIYSAALSESRLRDIFFVLESLPEAYRYAEPIIDLATPKEKERFAIFKASQLAIMNASRKPESSNSSLPLFS